MGTVLISPEEYLRTDFEPDADFVDGVVEERPKGEYNHSSWQDALLAWFRLHAREWNIRTRPELRLRVAPTRYRVPDIAVLDRNQPTQPVLTAAPIAVIEILSPEDRLKLLMIKLEDYRQMGVDAIIVIDPEDGRFHRYSQGSLEVVEDRVLHLGTGPVLLDRKAVQELLN